VRTGRRGQQVISASIDFAIAEAQDAMAESEACELERARAIDKAYHDTKKSFWITTAGFTGKATYKPSETWEEDAPCIVRHPIAGTDLSELVINGSQRVGAGTLSRETFMRLDPMVEDVQGETQKIRFEAIELAFFTSVQTMAADPQGPWQPADLARIGLKMEGENKEWWVAVDELQREKQAEQAQGAPEGAPETQPGLSMPGQGAEVPATIPGLGPGADQATSLLAQLGVADQALRMRT